MGEGALGTGWLGHWLNFLPEKVDGGRRLSSGMQFLPQPFLGSVSGFGRLCSQAPGLAQDGRTCSETTLCSSPSRHERAKEETINDEELTGPSQLPQPDHSASFLPHTSPSNTADVSSFSCQAMSTSLPPYFFKTCGLAPAHLHSTQAALSKGPMTSVLSGPVPTSQTSFLLVSLWILQ